MKARKPEQLPATDSPLITYEEWAGRWKTTVRTIKGYVHRNKVPVLRMNQKLVRIRLSDILAIEARSCGSKAEVK